MKPGNRFLMGSLLVAALVLGLVVPGGRVSLAAGAIHYVDADAIGDADGTSWTDAFTDLQVALDAAQSGDQVWVVAGTYVPSVEHGGTGDRYQSFQMKNGVAIYGGFIGTESLLEQRDWEANPTILSGDLNGDDGPDFANMEDNSYHVFYHPPEIALNASARLDGFTIRGGNANDVGTHTQGGGMYNYYCSPTLMNVTFTLNRATFGGGMFNDNASEPLLTAVTFAANDGGVQGGGMANYFLSNPSLTNVVFNGNYATQGGGMYNYYYSSPALINVVFSGNTAGFEGGGIYNDSGSDPRLTNITFAGNDAGMAGGMYNDNSDPILINAILWDLPTVEIYNNSSSTPHISYSDIKGGCPTYAICDQVINLDPQFVDAASGDLRLQLTSPAIDAGDNTAVPAGVVIDLDGNPRFVDIFTVPDTGNGTAPIVDMGAYETYAETIAPTVVSILRADPNPTHADSVDFVVTFSEDVGGVDAGDFCLFTTGSLSGSNVTDVSGTGSTYTVTVAVGSGIGSLRLDIPDTASITDLVGNPLSGLPYQSGEVYTILLQIYLPAIAKHTP